MKKLTRKKIFFSKVSKTKNCWLWTGYKNNKGYGSFLYPKGTLAHRYSYLVHNGEIPDDMMVCHSCDNPSCVNPEHLWIGTAQNNMDDCIRKNRNKIVTVRGEENGLSKLNERQVCEILKNENKLTQKEFANKFRCDQTTIHYVQYGKTWKHILPGVIRKTSNRGRRLSIKTPTSLQIWIKEYHAKKNRIQKKDTK